METKVCVSCGVMFPRHPKYGRAQWERAKFCSNSCRGQTLRKQRKLCECGCGQRVRKVNSRYRPGHNPKESAVLTLWTAKGRKPRIVFRDRQGRQVYFARAVMEAHLGRHLRSGEVVHHIDGDTLNDRLENLRLYGSHSEHMRDEYRAGALHAMN